MAYGNLLNKQTANLEKEDKSITYDYDYSRLTAIMYPDHPENNVKYTYGNKNASNNRVGRLMLQEDGSGAQEFFYGRLGEMTKVRRTLIIPNQAIATYVTQWKYDSWNRLEEMIYPDEEKITYSYNTAGLLESVKGEKAYSYNYVNKLGYDKFEQRIYMKYCNGAETNYTYDAQRRRLSNLMVISGKDTRKQIMNNNYTFDAVDNVLSVVNTAPLPATGMGGQMSHTYNYDGLYRLTSATGTFTGVNIAANNPKTASYSLEMAYDNLHNIVSKKQHVQQKGIQFDGVLKAGYELAYNYSSEKPHQIANIVDDNYRTEGTDAQDVTKKEHKYEYDLNGNLVYVNTERPKKDGTQTPKSAERKLLWDEENRLQAIDDNGFVSNYWYDAAGERTVKTSGESQQMYVNSVFSGGDTQTANFTAYVNPYLVVSKGGQYTKHIYIGSQRIVSKLGDLDSYGSDPRRIEYAGTNVDGAKVDYATKYTALQQTIKDRYGKFEVEYLGKDNDDYVNGQGFCCDDTPKTKSFAANDNPELFQYYYHSDHLGSSSLITNLDGEVVQHIEYVPFGEVFIEERNNTWNTPYLFNAKELDEETGLYYYGARYYDPRTSVWISTDPMWEKYPNISAYAYCALNPVKFVDPDGEAWKPSHYTKINGTKVPTGFSWVEKENSYQANGKLKEGLYEQAIFFSDNGTFSFDEPKNIGSSTATVYKADGTTVTFDACTYPSQSTQLTIPEGDYKAVVGLHKSQYTALRMSDDGTMWGKIQLPFKNPNNPNVTYAIGVNVHKPGKDNTTQGHSVACFNIDINRWNEFIGIFNNPEQKSNVIGIGVSRTLAVPTNMDGSLGSTLKAIGSVLASPITAPVSTAYKTIESLIKNKPEN
ncbi:hypothetical protein FACS1894169_06230 [Bacteroidia bacterium]|nr:hypothetical protein FACS1894169_06230 [Bacteroidia bacterium]